MEQFSRGCLLQLRGTASRRGALLSSTAPPRSPRSGRARSASSPLCSSPTSWARRRWPAPRTQNGRARSSTASTTRWRPRSRRPAARSRSSSATRSWRLSALRSRRRTTPIARSMRRCPCVEHSSEMFGDTLRLRIGVNTGDVVVGRAARREFVRDRRRSERRGPPRAGGEAGRDPRGRAHGRGRAQRLSVRPGDDDRGEGKGRGGRLPPAARAAASTVESRPARDVRRPRAGAGGSPRGVRGAVRDESGRFWSRSWASRGSARARSAGVPPLAGAQSAAAGRTCRALPFVRAGKRVLAPWRCRPRPSGPRRAVAHPRSRARPAGATRPAPAGGCPAAARRRGSSSWRNSPLQGRSSCSWKTCTGPIRELLELLGARQSVQRPAPAARDGPSRGRARRRDDRAGPAAARGCAEDRRRPRARNPGGGRADVRGRALGRQSALRRGDHADAGRPGRDGRDSCSDLVVPDTVQALLAERIDLLAAGGEGRAPGRRGDRSDFRRRRRARTDLGGASIRRAGRARLRSERPPPSSSSCTPSHARSPMAA